MADPIHGISTALKKRRPEQAPTEALERLRRLFWDKPLEPEDLTRHPRWVIQRVLEMGNLQDVQGLIGMVGKESFLGEVCCLRFSSEKTTALWQAMLKLEGVRCTSESSRRAARISWLR